MAATEEKNTVSKTLSYIDETLQRANVSDLQLVIQIARDGIVLAVKAADKNKYLALEAFEFTNVYHLTEVTHVMDEVIKTSALIAPNYHSTTCIVVNNLSTLVPIPFYDEGNERLYLKFNVPLEWNDLLLVDEVKSVSAKNIFAVPYELKAKLDGYFKNIRYVHHSSILIESLVVKSKNKTDKKIYISIAPTHFELLLVENNKLLFYNSFDIQAPEDLLYYLLFVCEQLELNTEQTALVVIGQTDVNAPVIQLLQKYIRNISFARREDEIVVGYQMQALPSHFYYSIFNQYYSLI